VLDKAQYSAFESTLNSAIVSYRGTTILGGGMAITGGGTPDTSGGTPFRLNLTTEWYTRFREMPHGVVNQILRPGLSQPTSKYRRNK